MVFWGLFFIVSMVTQIYYQYALKKHETELWKSFGKPSAFNAKGFWKSSWYVIAGKYSKSNNQKFKQACDYHRVAMILLFVVAVVVFGVWPATWHS